MSEFRERLTRLALPSWMDKGEPAKLLSAARVFWSQVYGWLTWPLAQLDAETCTEALLSVLAYQRDIQRFNGEPLPLFRKRVKYAFINAKDAGSIAGFIAIFERLGVGYVELLERQPDIDWDVIILRLSDGQIAANPDLLMNIIRQYGRTCRRYRFEVIAKNQLLMRVGSIRQTLSQGNTLPDIKPCEQLQQQRAEVSQRVTQEGSWIRQTDQTINESSMHREIKADTETRTVVARDTTIQATDKTLVLGTSTLLAGAVQQVAEGDYSLATSSHYLASVGKNATIDVGQTLIEKIGLLKQSIAGVKQEIVAPVVWVGSPQINVMTLMLDTLDVVKELAELTAAHTHHNTGTPQNASAIRGTAHKSDGLKQKYSPVIG